MSEVKVNKVSSRTGNAVTLGNSGDTLTVPSGVTITSAGTVSGGFKDIQWQSVVTADGSTNTTAEAGKGYLIDVSSATHTINLPSSPSLGDTVVITDFTGSSQLNNITIGRNGSNIEGAASDLTFGANKDSAELVYTNATQGWVRTSKIQGETFISATGGTETTSGNFKIHTFTSSGCFVVSGVSVSCSSYNDVSYLVVAGGGGGGACGGGGGGAGGFREGKDAGATHTASPYAATSGITVTAQTYPITVGAGGAGGSTPSAGADGSNSVFATITSAGGGKGGRYQPTAPVPPGDQGGSGGSGGGAGGVGPSAIISGGTGNSPPVSPSQGNNGGTGQHLSGCTMRSGGGGGRGGAGGNGTNQSPGPGSSAGGTGGVGTPTSISGTATSYAGGGGGAGFGANGSSAGSPCGTGGKGTNNNSDSTVAGSTNRGGGGGGGSHPGGGTNCGSAGGSGIVIIRYKYQ